MKQVRKYDETLSVWDVISHEFGPKRSTEITELPKGKWPLPPLPNEPVGKCPKCGIELHQVMLYSCQNNDCPTFVKVVY